MIIAHLITNVSKKFWNSTDGGVAVIAAFSFIVILTITSISIEISRVHYVNTLLANAADAAAIAGARYDIEDVQENARKVFDANFPPGTLGITPDPIITYSAADQTVSVEVDESMPTIIGKAVGIKTLPVKAESTVVREFGGLELAMALDVTGSMASDGKINGLISAAKALVDVIYEGENSREDTAISIVPFVATVNIGSNNTSWLTNPTVASSTTYFPSGQAWQGCVMAQEPMKETGDENIDTKPPAQKWATYFVPSTNPLKDSDNNWTANKGVFKVVSSAESGVSVGPNRSCAQPILPLVNNAALVKATINQFKPTNGGGTIGSLGMIWAARTLSEFWDGAWTVRQSNGTVVTGVPIKKYDAPTNTKALIIMTDGETQWYDDPNHVPTTGDPNAYGTGTGISGNTINSYPNDTSYNNRFVSGKSGATARHSTAATSFNNKINKKIARICEDVKAKGIEVYTITFRVSDAATKDLYLKCATGSDHYAAAESNQQLVDIFEKIAKQLKRLRITH